MDKKLETQIKKRFEKIGRDYNSITNKKTFQYYQERRKKYLEEICENIGRDKIIIDLAAGTGAYSENISNHCFLLNMDLSFNALKANTILNDRILKINANALNIPLKNNSVDSILLIGLLHHIPNDLPELFREILRVLKNDGTVVIDEPNGYNLTWFIYMKLCKIDKFEAKPLFPYAIKKLAKRFYLKIEKDLYWGFVPPLPNKQFIINIFNRIGLIIEKSFLSCLCTRYLLILKK